MKPRRRSSDTNVPSAPNVIVSFLSPTVPRQPPTIFAAYSASPTATSGEHDDSPHVSNKLNKRRRAKSMISPNSDLQSRLETQWVIKTGPLFIARITPSAGQTWSARIVRWSSRTFCGTGRSIPSNLMIEPINPSVWRRANRNTARKVKAVSLRGRNSDVGRPASFAAVLSNPRALPRQTRSSDFRDCEAPHHSLGNWLPGISDGEYADGLCDEI